MGAEPGAASLGFNLNNQTKWVIHLLMIHQFTWIHITGLHTVSTIGSATTTSISVTDFFMHVADFNLTDSLICIDSFTAVPQTPAICDIATQIQNTLIQSPLIEPNPARRLLHHSLLIRLKKEITAMLTDELGRMVKQFILSTAFDSQLVQVNDLSSGVYLLILTGDMKTQTMKVIVKR